MHEKVKEFLIKKRNEELDKKESEKKELLISLGLSEKVYYDRQIDDDCFPEFDKSTQTTRYYKEVPIDVSNEEYALIKKYSSTDKKANPSNTIASILQVIAVLTYIGGALAGLIYADADFLLTIIFWIGAFISGTSFLGFAEIINILHEIRNIGE